MTEIERERELIRKWMDDLPEMYTWTEQRLQSLVDDLLSRQRAARSDGAAHRLSDREAHDMIQRLLDEGRLMPASTELGGSAFMPLVNDDYDCWWPR